LGILRFVSQSLFSHSFSFCLVKKSCPHDYSRYTLQRTITSALDGRFLDIDAVLFFICRRWKVPGMAGPPSS
jgi:hypothetical protein